jgi:hypothetical protein
MIASCRGAAPRSLRQWSARGERRRRRRIHDVLPGSHRLHAGRGTPSGDEADWRHQATTDDSRLLRDADVPTLQTTSDHGCPRSEPVSVQLPCRCKCGSARVSDRRKTRSETACPATLRLSASGDRPRPGGLAAHAVQWTGRRFAWKRTPDRHCEDANSPPRRRACSSPRRRLGLSARPLRRVLSRIRASLDLSG